MEINELDAIYAVQKIYPKSNKATLIKKGFSHKNYVVETNAYPEKVILRIENSKKIKFDLRKEKRIYEMLNKKGIPTPRIIHLDATKERVNFNFMIESFAEGIDLEDIWSKLTKKEQEKLTEQIGEIMGKIHETKFEEFGYLTAGGIENENGFSFKKTGEKIELNPAEAEILSKAFFDMGKIVANEKINDDQKLQIFNYLIKNKNLANSKEKPSFIHGDIHIDHFRVKKIKGQWTICCLLDVEFAASIQREYDFIKLHRTGFFHKLNLKNSLLKGYLKYHSLPEQFEEKVKFLRITRDISFLSLMYSCGNIGKAKEVLNHIMDEII